MRKIYPIVFIVLALFVRAGAQTEQNGEFIAEEQKPFIIAGVKFINKSIIEKSESKMFEIKASYPELADASPAIAARFNELTKTKVMKELREFKKIALAQTEDASAFAGERNFGSIYLEMNYRLDFANERVLSVAFGNSAYEGGESPNLYSFTINFDLKTGKKIELADIFKPNSNYLKFLSDYSIRNLKEKLEDMSDEEWLQNGAGAQPENFGSWNLTKKGLLINFDPVRVASAAAGPRQVLIPYSDLKGILQENGVISQ
jgi:hypothetical protein